MLLTNHIQGDVLDTFIFSNFYKLIISVVSKSFTYFEIPTDMKYHVMGLKVLFIYNI